MHTLGLSRGPGRHGGRASWRDSCQLSLVGLFEVRHCLLLSRQRALLHVLHDHLVHLAAATEKLGRVLLTTLANAPSNVILKCL